MDRRDFLLDGIDRNTAHGIEIGPFFNPIAPKSKGWNTTIVDFTDQNALLETAKGHSAASIREMAVNIEPVDVIWRDVRLDQACLRIRPEGFDYLIASHAIEHFPDIITFFQQVSLLARPGFVLSLAVPDCRLTFDFFRPLSNTAQALIAHRERRTIHTPETMFDTYAYMVHQDGAAVWVPDNLGKLALVVPLEQSHQQYCDYLHASLAGTRSYVDAHCWIFTPSSFRLMILELNQLGYIDFIVTRMEPGAGSEFLTQLRKDPRRLDPEELQVSRLALLKSARRELAESVKYL